MRSVGGRSGSYSTRISASARQVGWRRRIARHAVATDGGHLPVADDGCVRHGFAARPAGGLVEERVLVEIRVGGQPLDRRSVAEDRPDRRAEDLGEVEVDRPDRPVEVDLLVQEEPRREEHLERAQPRLIERQPRVADERVAPEPLDVDIEGDTGHVGVAPDVVEVVDGEHAGQQRLEPPDPARHRLVRERRLRDQE